MQARLAPVPAVEKPGEQAHVAAPALLVLPAVHELHDDAPAKLNLFAGQTARGKVYKGKRGARGLVSTRLRQPIKFLLFLRTGARQAGSGGRAGVAGLAEARASPGSAEAVGRARSARRGAPQAVRAHRAFCRSISRTANNSALVYRIEVD